MTARRYVLKVPCMACNRSAGVELCVLCSALERAEAAASGVEVFSKQVRLMEVEAAFDGQAFYPRVKERR